VAVKAPLLFNKLIIEMRWLDPIWVPEIFSSRMKISEAPNGLGEMNMLKSKATSPEVSSWAFKADRYKSLILDHKLKFIVKLTLSSDKTVSRFPHRRFSKTMNKQIWFLCCEE
jgi:hypothetical protein